MSRFFVDRPIVAMVISILMVLLRVVALAQLPVSLYPNLAPPEVLVQATYVGADALTIEEAVASPIEAQMTGVDNMLYMYSTSTISGGQMDLRNIANINGCIGKEPWKGPAAPVFGNSSSSRASRRGHVVRGEPVSRLHRETGSDSGFALAGAGAGWQDPPAPG